MSLSAKAFFTAILVSFFALPKLALHKISPVGTLASVLDSPKPKVHAMMCRDPESLAQKQIPLERSLVDIS